MPSVLVRLADHLTEALRMEAADEESAAFSQEFIARRSWLAQYTVAELSGCCRVDVVPSADTVVPEEGTRAERMHEYVVYVVVSRWTSRLREEGDEDEDPETLDCVADQIEQLAENIQDWLDRLHPLQVESDSPLAGLRYYGTNRVNPFDHETYRTENIVRFVIECRYRGLR